MDNQEHLTGRYEIRLNSRGGKPLTVDTTNNPGTAITKAEHIGGKAIDTLTGDVWSHQAQTWLGEATQAVIEGQTATAKPDLMAIGLAIVKDALDKARREGAAI